MTPRIFVGRFDSKFLGVTLRASTKAEAVAMRLQDLSARVDPALFDRLPDDEVITDLGALAPRKTPVGLGVTAR